eukprot:1196043-Prorocentrum_minimum.AAC.3
MADIHCCLSCLAVGETVGEGVGEGVEPGTRRRWGPGTRGACRRRSGGPGQGRRQIAGRSSGR